MRGGPVSTAPYAGDVVLLRRRAGAHDHRVPFAIRPRGDVRARAARGGHDGAGVGSASRARRQPGPKGRCAPALHERNDRKAQGRRDHPRQSGRAAGPRRRGLGMDGRRRPLARPAPAPPPRPGHRLAHLGPRRRGDALPQRVRRKGDLGRHADGERLHGGAHGARAPARRPRRGRRCHAPPVGRGRPRAPGHHERQCGPSGDRRRALARAHRSLPPRALRNDRDRRGDVQSPGRRRAQARHRRGSASHGPYPHRGRKRRRCRRRRALDWRPERVLRLSREARRDARSLRGRRGRAMVQDGRHGDPGRGRVLPDPRAHERRHPQERRVQAQRARESRRSCASTERSRRSPSSG